MYPIIRLGDKIMERTVIKKTGSTTTLSEYILISLDSPEGSDRFEKICHHFHSITR
jgi:hypothetical protein